MTSPDRAEVRTESARISRNRPETEGRILDAVEHILASEGYQALGINRIAREAGVGKVLIYRYFGGLQGVLDAYGATERLWPDVSELRGMAEDEFRSLSLRHRVRHLFRNFRSALKRRPHTIAIYAWEVAEKQDLGRQLVARRAQASLLLVRHMFGAGCARTGTHFEHEISVLLAAGLLHLTIREHFKTPFAGLPLEEEAVWDRLELAMDRVFAGLERLALDEASPEDGPSPLSRPRIDQ